MIFFLDLQATYTSELTKENQVYPRICGKGNYHYETIRISVQQNGSYMFNSDTYISIPLYGYLYESDFDLSHPNKNLLAKTNESCKNLQLKLGSYLEINRTYILLVTTFDPDVRGPFTLLINGPKNITLNRFD